MPKRITIAEDDLAILDAMHIILNNSGYSITGLNNIEDEQSISNTNPDLILLDIWLSGADGKEICKNLKSSEKTKNIPVIIVSANSQTEKIAKKIGADDFLLKPFDMKDLKQIVSKHI